MALISIWLLAAISICLAKANNHDNKLIMNSVPANIQASKIANIPNSMPANMQNIHESMPHMSNTPINTQAQKAVNIQNQHAVNIPTNTLGVMPNLQGNNNVNFANVPNKVAQKSSHLPDGMANIPTQIPESFKNMPNFPANFQANKVANSMNSMHGDISNIPQNFQSMPNMQNIPVNMQSMMANMQNMPANMQSMLANMPSKMLNVPNVNAQSKMQKSSPMLTESDINQLNMINMPPGFSQKYLDYDPCLSSPCMFGRICKSVPVQEVSSGFICLNEIDANKEISDARMIYRNMELLAKEAILLNVETISNHGQPPLPSSLQQQLMSQQQQQQLSPAFNNEQHVMLTLKTIKPVKLTCEQTPCQKNEKCIPKPESDEGHVCVKARITVVEDENNKIVGHLLSDEKFVNETASRCQSVERSLHQRLDIANMSTHFITCLEHGEFTIQSCPENLVFNKHFDRCDIDLEPASFGCASSPCQFGAVCHDLANLD